eukprot:1192874-Prorocentrum_minimum.AAC.1
MPRGMTSQRGVGRGSEGGVSGKLNGALLRRERMKSWSSWKAFAEGSKNGGPSRGQSGATQDSLRGCVSASTQDRASRPQ